MRHTPISVREPSYDTLSALDKLSSTHALERGSRTLSRHPTRMTHYIMRCYLLLRSGISEVLACKQVQRTPAPHTFRIDIVGLISNRTSGVRSTLPEPLVSKSPGARTNSRPQ